MAREYSVEVCQKLAERFAAAQLHRPMRIGRYDAGTELTYQVKGVLCGREASARLVVERFVGGGFAGQVYQVRLLSVDSPEGAVADLEPGRLLAMKILVPPSGFSRVFRNLIYWLGFQAPFQLQVNPAAAQAGALWQKFIRRAVKVRFGDESSVADILATFVDGNMGSCGELSEWVDGRTWRLETDDRLDLLKLWKRGKHVDSSQLGSGEYRAKRQFMDSFVTLLHEMGAPELARQYEWSTCKSQPNCLKRYDSEPDEASGLTAVDFRAGLALLPYLPMSPGDFKLIVKGIGRGSLVQFDRGDLNKLERFCRSHPEAFGDMHGAMERLRQAETIYRNSQPDITHNHVRLLYSGSLWSGLFGSAVTGWQVRNFVDHEFGEKLRRRRLATVLFGLMGVLPFLGRLGRRLWGRADYRRHYGSMLASVSYLRRALAGRIAERLCVWHRGGRVSAERALKLADRPARFLLHLPLSILPGGLHRFVTDWAFFTEKLDYIFVRPFRLLFRPAAREQWLRDMVEDGRKNHLITDEDAQVILSQLKERYIQVYLISLAVHVCTLPITQIISVMVAWWYVNAHPELTGAQATARAAAILAAFQLTPVSPGSFVRGLYVLGLVIYERNVRDYKLALALGFFKYIGYLAFPLQMAYRYPVLARFMAAHWATGAVHIVPVFGEHGALLEHGVFSIFYNLPLMLRRRMALRAELRAKLPERRWHVAVCALAGAAMFAVADLSYLHIDCVCVVPSLVDIWWLTAAIPMLAGAVVTLAAGGLALSKRIVQAAVCGLTMGVLYAVFHTWWQGRVEIIAPPEATEAATFSQQLGGFVSCLIWRVFIFAILAVVGAIVTELQLGEPETPAAAGAGED